jgi:hypothetical protein
MSYAAWYIGLEGVFGSYVTLEFLSPLIHAAPIQAELRFFVMFGRLGLLFCIEMLFGGLYELRIKIFT